MKWWGKTYPAKVPRLIMSSRENDAPNPVRIYPDATGEGSLASLRFLSVAARPRRSPLRTQAKWKLRGVAEISNRMYICELFAAVATIFQLRVKQWGRKAILFVDNEAASAASTRGAAGNKVTLMLVFTMWSPAAQYDIAISTERAPSKVNPADLPPGNRRLDFEADPKKDLASAQDFFSVFDLSWMFQHADWPGLFTELTKLNVPTS